MAIPKNSNGKASKPGKKPGAIPKNVNGNKKKPKSGGKK